ncbi:MAG: hypothetical protein Q7S28_02075 [bacterium]|nr:hypothetical protein [bacterium]
MPVDRFSYEKRGDVYWPDGPGDYCFALIKDKVRRITVGGWPE